MKLCTLCKEVKPLEDFWLLKGKPKYQCKDCETTKAMYRLYGITLEEYNAMFIEQGGLCAICFSTPTKSRFNIDHDHNTGNVRGLLCWRCNATLGKVNDDPELLHSMANYLEDF